MNSKPKQPISPESWTRVVELFEKALLLPSPAARAQFLDNETAGDLGLRHEVEFLLSSSIDLEGFLEVPIGPRAAHALVSHRPTQDLPIGTSIGDFEILEVLGRGSFATVYLARQSSLDRQVALKVSANRGREARMMAHLEHDHILKVFSESLDRERELRLLCMPFVSGCSLESLMRDISHKGTLPRTGRALFTIIDSYSKPTVLFNPAALKDREILSRADFVESTIWIGMRIADALAYANDKGILHLDVKPSNILINSYGRPLLTDFNVSIDARDFASGVPEMLGGTFNYMSPEQSALFADTDKVAALQKIDGRSDVYSLGVVLWEFLARGSSREPLEVRVPEQIEKTATAALFRDHLRTVPLGNVDPELRAVLTVATESDPDTRFHNSAELQRALEGCLELRRIRKRLPPTGWFLNQFATHPLIALTLVGAIPQLLASIFGITYNSLRVIRFLNASQQHLFWSLNLYFSPFTYTVSFIVWIRQMRKFAPYLRDPNSYVKRQESLKKLRRDLLAIPWLGVGVSTWGWGAGFWVYALCLQFKMGPLPRMIFVHLFFSFGLSYLIALAYSFVLHDLIVMRVLYPKFWFGASGIRKTAERELRGLRRNLRGVLFLTGLIPLAGAVLILGMGPDTFTQESYRGFRWLVAFLISLGKFGLLFALWAGQQLTQIAYAFTGASKADRKSQIDTSKGV